MARTLGRALVAGIILCAAQEGCKSASFSGGATYKQGPQRTPAKDTKKDDFVRNSAFPDKTDQENGTGPDVGKGDGPGNASNKGPGNGTDKAVGGTAGPTTSGGNTAGGIGGKTTGATAGGIGANSANGTGGLGQNSGGATGGPSLDVGSVVGSLVGLLGSGGGKSKAWEPADISDWWQYPHKCNGPEAEGGGDDALFDHKLSKDECKSECEKRGFSNFKDCANPNLATEDGNKGSIDPLVIDLTSSGVALSPQWEGVRFDIKGQGKKTRISWPTTPGTSVFVALAPEPGGAIDQSVHSLFGDRTLGPDGAPAADGFAALAKWDLQAYGGNGDGVISKDDAVWPRLRGWRNMARDGVLKTPELMALDALGVHKIDVTPVNGLETDRYGNATGRRSVVCLGDCDSNDSVTWTKSMVFDIWFKTDRSFTK